MKKPILASACALALAGGGAVAQTQQPAPEASPGISKHMSKHTMHMKHARRMKKETTGQTTGMARSKGTTGQTTGTAPSKTKQPGAQY
ncbi:MAG TPA: hypothetical protein VKR55_30720 [Bradyrhizobium sp.]|uniref:hypothetical protein n=1 Tax=Bradyrhizobium sp. TaxID=376 RepID=UPI002C1F34D7|nr:hypothetical protein [Bradyrhizobium sp.]HLZ06507.1 hypothetical protein [Bradyrhizobium sp.]